VARGETLLKNHSNLEKLGGGIWEMGVAIVGEGGCKTWKGGWKKS